MTVIQYNETTGAVASTSFRRWVAEELTAQDGALIQACEQKSNKSKLYSTMSQFSMWDDHYYPVCQEFLISIMSSIITIMKCKLAQQS